MIRVNLLPADFRRRDAAPIARLAALAAGVVVAVGAAAAFAFTYFVKLELAKQQESAAAQEWKDAEAQQRHSLELKTEIGFFERRREAIRDIVARRAVWSRTLDRLWDIIDNDAATEPYHVWLDSLQVTPPPASVAKGREQTGGSVKMRGNSVGYEFGRVAALLRALMEPSREFAEDFLEGAKGFAPPSFQLHDKKDGRTPSTVGVFEMTMNLKPLDWRRPVSAPTNGGGPAPRGAAQRPPRAPTAPPQKK